MALEGQIKFLGISFCMQRMTSDSIIYNNIIWIIRYLLNIFFEILSNISLLLKIKRIWIFMFKYSLIFPVLWHILAVICDITCYIFRLILQDAVKDYRSNCTTLVKLLVPQYTIILKIYYSKLTNLSICLIVSLLSNS